VTGPVVRVFATKLLLSWTTRAILEKRIGNESYEGQHNTAVVSGPIVIKLFSAGAEELNVVAAVHPNGHIAGLSGWG
jgi:galactokinase/mevalonate kinase-like predicted kinase